MNLWLFAFVEPEDLKYAAYKAQQTMSTASAGDEMLVGKLETAKLEAQPQTRQKIIFLLIYRSRTLLATWVTILSLVACSKSCSCMSTVDLETMLSRNDATRHWYANNNSWIKTISTFFNKNIAFIIHFFSSAFSHVLASINSHSTTKTEIVPLLMPAHHYHIISISP